MTRLATSPASQGKGVVRSAQNIEKVYEIASYGDAIMPRLADRLGSDAERVDRAVAIAGDRAV